MNTLKILNLDLGSFNQLWGAICAAYEELQTGTQGSAMVLKKMMRSPSSGARRRQSKDREIGSGSHFHCRKVDLTPFTRFANRDDRNRELFLTVLAFDVPTPRQ